MIKNNSEKAALGVFAKFILLALLSFNFYSATYAQSVDAFKVANQLLAQKKFRKAHKLLQSYHRGHPTDLNSIWMDAQTKLWLNNYKQSDRLYRKALPIQPGNDYLKLSYIHSLLDMGKFRSADKMLAGMEQGGKDYSDMARLRARLYFYLGKYQLAWAFLDKAMQLDYDNSDANALYDELEMAEAPKVSLGSGYYTDNQVITMVVSTLKAEKYFNRFLSLYLICDEYHFLQPTLSDAPWVRAGDRLSFPKAGIQINAGGGVFKFPVKNEVAWSGNISVTKKIAPQFDLALAADHVPYLDAKASVDSNITQTRLSAMLNWHKRSWLGQAAVLDNVFPGNNNVYAAYLWILAPIAHFSFGQLSIGYSSSYSNADKNSYMPVNSISDIVANYGANPSVAGTYSPYFTPDSLFVNSALLALKLDISKKVSLNINGDIGYGTAQTPYLYLDKDAAGNFITVKGYYTQSFTPYNATVAFNYHIDRTWLLSARYIYHNTYFFTSNYVSLGVEKSFLHRETQQPDDGTGSAFSRMIHDIDGKIQALANCKSADELKIAAGKIKEQLTALRDAQQQKKDLSEILPGSDEANRLKERCENLNDMLNELDAVTLDEDGSGSGKKQWLANKLYELTAISYPGSPED